MLSSQPVEPVNDAGNIEGHIFNAATVDKKACETITTNDEVNIRNLFIVKNSDCYWFQT